MKQKTNLEVRCNICNKPFLRKSATGQIFCPDCRKYSRILGLSRPYTKDTAFFINKWFDEYVAKGIKPSAALKKVALILNRSEENVLIGLTPDRKEVLSANAKA